MNISQKEIMRDICGDIGPENHLSINEKLTYLFQNILRGIFEWSFPGKVRGWRGKLVAHGSDSPARAYVDSYLKSELPKLVFPGTVRVLDIGCGTGYMQNLLAELGYRGEYVGLDVVRESGFKAHSDAFHVSFVQSRIEDYTSEKKFDVVFSNTALEHITDDKKAAQVAHDVLAEGGVGVHLVPSFWSLFLYLFHGYRHYTPKMIRKTFVGQDVQITGLGGFASFLLQFFFSTVPERLLRAGSWRAVSWYPKAVRIAGTLDQFLPFCRSISAVVVRPSVPSIKRVTFVLPSLLVGGIEHQLVSQLKHYDRSKFSFRIITLFEYPGRESLHHLVPDDVLFASASISKPLDFSGWRRFYRLLKEADADVVVSSMFSANAAVRLLKPLFKYAVITREHNIYDEKTLLQRSIDRLLAPFSCRIIAVSREVARFTAKQAGIGAGKFSVIQNGVDVKRLSHWAGSRQDVYALKKEIGLLETDKVILTVGRLKKWKNHAALIEGFLKFQKDYPEYRLVIIGTGAEQEALRERIQRAPLDRVLLLERFGEAVWPYYRVADWFILPSLREGFPNVMLEAMAFGVPLLGTEISGTEECIEDGVNGYYIPSSASGIAGSLRRVAKVSDREREDMGRASRKKVEEFSIEETVRKYEETFLTCANKI